MVVFFYNPRTVMVMNLFKHWYQIDQHQLTCTHPAYNSTSISRAALAPETQVRTMAREENEVVNIRTHFNSRSHTVKRGPIIMPSHI